MLTYFHQPKIKKKTVQFSELFLQPKAAHLIKAGILRHKHNNMIYKNFLVCSRKHVLFCVNIIRELNWY